MVPHPRSVHGPVTAAADWWAGRRSEFSCVISDFVLLEIGRGNPEQAAARVRLVGHTDDMPVTSEWVNVASPHGVGG